MDFLPSCDQLNFLHNSTDLCYFYAKNQPKNAFLTQRIATIDNAFKAVYHEIQGTSNDMKQGSSSSKIMQTNYVNLLNFDFMFCGEI